LIFLAVTGRGRA